eukprot:TRINITY_DN11627_c0_g1_i1.p1 TRINITY_DN11627_c0_g1~~TRINITY_DN11627_c0_g1_i1.p1  ORF type:complete len:459 (-),score=50.14 TRINITY_DN11627_c0_g1_i1:36-1412(-)
MEEDDSIEIIEDDSIEIIDYIDLTDPNEDTMFDIFDRLSKEMERKGKCDFIPKLPRDILFHLLEDDEIFVLKRYLLVSYEWYCTFNDDAVWRLFYRKYFMDEMDSTYVSELMHGWKNSFKRMYSRLSSFIPEMCTVIDPCCRYNRLFDRVFPLNRSVYPDGIVAFAASKDDVTMLSLDGSVIRLDPPSQIIKIDSKEESQKSVCEYLYDNPSESLVVSHIGKIDIYQYKGNSWRIILPANPFRIALSVNLLLIIMDNGYLYSVNLNLNSFHLVSKSLNDIEMIKDPIYKNSFYYLEKKTLKSIHLSSGKISTLVKDSFHTVSIENNWILLQYRKKLKILQLPNLKELQALRGSQSTLMYSRYDNALYALDNTEIYRATTKQKTWQIIGKYPKSSRYHHLHHHIFLLFSNNMTSINTITGKIESKMFFPGTMEGMNSKFVFYKNISEYETLIYNYTNLE